MSAFLNIDSQIASMKTTWPRFRLIERKGQFAAWVGDVRPLMQSYRIGIRYTAPAVVQMLDRRRMQPMVAVLSPQLRPRPGDPEGQLPHVYYVGDGPLDVVLCLLDPDSDEWSPFMPLAETTVPWAIDWLASYEGWRATGKWTATGKHVPRGMEMAG